MTTGRKARPTSTSWRGMIRWMTRRPCTPAWPRATRELTEFRAEISDLRDQLRLLAETERLDIKNVL